MIANMRIKSLIFIVILLFTITLNASDRINSWQDYFPDPVERIYIVMKGGLAFKKTNYEEHLVRMGAGILEETLKKKSYKIKDIAIIIHNHRIERKFSPADWKFYIDLKRRGFNGRFLIYCHLTNKVYDIEKNEKSK